MANRNPSAEAYIKGLESIACKDRPREYEKLTDENLRRIGHKQLEIFTRATWPMWRYYKVRLLNRLLDQREGIALDIINVFPDKIETARSISYQEVTNGIIGSAIAEYCQCMEDLAALTSAMADIRYFARRLEYSAGRMQNRIIEWKSITRNECLEMLYIPILKERVFDGDTEAFKEYNTLIDLIVEQICTASSIYENHLAHYTAYKHGMSYALRPYSDFDDETIAKKKYDKSGYPVIFDNGSIEEALADVNFRGTLKLPSKFEPLTFNLVDLARDRNLLRYVNAPIYKKGKTISCDDIETICRIIGRIQQIAILNCLSFHNEDRKKDEFHTFNLLARNGKLMEISRIS